MPQQFTGQQRRQLRRVGERFAPDLRQALQQIQALARVHAVQVMLHTQMARDLRRPVALVMSRIVEADRPCFDRQVGLGRIIAVTSEESVPPDRNAPQASGECMREAMAFEVPPR